MEDLFGTNGRATEWLDPAVALIMTYAPKVVLAIITLVVGLWLIKRLINVLDRKLAQKDPTLNKFLCGLVGAILKILLLISVASMVGIATTSFVAIIGAAGLAVGLALQGSLANFAGGVLILIFKPFKVGDVIDVPKGTQMTKYTTQQVQAGIKFLSNANVNMDVEYDGDERQVQFNIATAPGTRFWTSGDSIWSKQVQKGVLVNGISLMATYTDYEEDNYWSGGLAGNIGYDGSGKNGTWYSSGDPANDSNPLITMDYLN